MMPTDHASWAAVCAYYQHAMHFSEGWRRCYVTQLVAHDPVVLRAALMELCSWHMQLMAVVVPAPCARLHSVLDAMMTDGEVLVRHRCTPPSSHTSAAETVTTGASLLENIRLSRLAGARVQAWLTTGDRSDGAAHG